MTSSTGHWDERPVAAALWLQRMGLAAPGRTTTAPDRRVRLVSGVSCLCLGLAIGGYFVQRGYSTIMVLVPLVNDAGEQGMLVRYGPLAALIGAVMLAPFDGLLRGIDLKHRPWLALLALWTVGLLVVGLMHGNPRYYLLIDLEVMVVLLSGILLGARSEVWPVLERAYSWVFALGIPVVLLGLFRLDLVDMRFGGKFTAEAYDSQYLLWPVGFFVMLYGSLPRGRARALVLLAFGMCVLEQVLFQKRAPTGRLLAFLGFAVVLMVMKPGRGLRRLAALPALLIGGALAVGVFSVVLGLSLSDVTDSFALRLTQAQGEQASSLENARFGFAARLLDSLAGSERWFGKGLGGYLVDSTFGYYVLTGQGTLVRGAASIEIGHTWSILKGGFVFLIVFNLPFAAALARGFAWRRLDPLDRAAWAFVATTVAFLFTESLMTHPNQLYWLLAGAAVGRLIMARREPPVARDEPRAAYGLRPGAFLAGS